MTKKYPLVFVACFAIQISFAQQLFFAKENYTDTALLQKNIKTLAAQSMAVYKDADESKYYDNLFRLQLVAQQYNKVEPTLTKLALIAWGDTVTTKALGFVFKMYNATMATNPTAANFAQTYNQIFTTTYDTLSEDGKNWAEEYFANETADQVKAFEGKKNQHKTQDSISIQDAVDLCRSYCSVICYTATSPLAKKLLTAIEKERYIKEDSVLVKMPDGGTVSLTIVRERKVTTPQPVVLMYNIYANADMSGRCKEATSRGYVGIIADTRGKRLSPNAIEPFEHDAKDAYYIIDWISKQPWCNGKVGMYGGSYLGFSQWSAVKHLHPALKTIVPQVSVGAGIDYPRHNGVFMTFMLRWLHFVSNNKLIDQSDFFDAAKWNDVYANWYKKGSSFRSLDTLEGRPNPIFQRWLQHSSYDSYWQQMTPQKQEFSKINIPIFTTTGYWDDDQTGAMYYYHQYQKWNKNNNYYLLIGPYDHGGSQAYPKRTLAGYTIDDVANIPILDIVFQWFNYTLKDSSRPAILKDKVNFEVMGSNEWKHVASLDKMSNDTLKFYLGNTSTNHQYPLLNSKPVKQDFIAQTVDLKDRSELRFISEEVSGFPAIVDSVLNPEKHKLVFVSDAIDKPFAISGAATAAIVASINKKDMDIAFDMYEQTPDGKYIALVTNLQRASYAADKTKRNLLTPGKQQTIAMNNTYITCRQLQKGSRIVVVMGINKNPQWQVNYGTGKDVSDETIQDAAVPMQIKWYNNSCIKIPVLR